MSNPRDMIWSWEDAITQSDLQPTTRLVLLVLRTFMNSKGGVCYPTIETLCMCSGLSKRAVILHLQKASEEGFIKVDKHGFKGQKWANNQYKATFPKGSAGYALDNEKVVHLTTKGGASNDQKVVQEVHTNRPVKHTIEQEIAPLIEKYECLARQGRAKKPRKYTATRKALLKARIKEYSAVECNEVLDKVAQSDFLSGKNDRGWKVSFDWLFKASNFAKVLDGNYDNEQPESAAPSGKSLWDKIKEKEAAQ